MIYILEDDESIRELLIYALSAEGMNAEGFARPSVMKKRLAEKLPELIIMDIMLPEEDGVSVLKDLRQKEETEDLPIMMLTAKSTEYDKITGLDSGADDYMTKPFSIMELVSRVKALLRRSRKKNEKSSILICGNIELDTKKHIVKVMGKEIVLALKEYELLEMLIKSEGDVLTREELLKEIWGYSFRGESRTIDVHIRTLRQKLGEDCIETVRGVGYKIRQKGEMN